MNHLPRIGLRGERTVERKGRTLMRPLLWLPVVVAFVVLYVLPALVVGSVTP